MDQLREKRIGIVGVIILAIFLTLISRLWYLQVANGEEFAAAATQSRIRVIQEQAPRGRILDINGDVIVDNRIARSIVVDRQQLKDEDRKKEVVAKLAETLDIDEESIEKRIADQRIAPYKPVPVAIDVPLEKIQYIKEHQDEFDGVNAVPLPVRRYPNGSVAAHIVGYVGEINDKELEDKKDEGYQLGETIGKSGIEFQYEDYLRGKPSVSRVEIDVKGNVLREVSAEPAVPGNDIVLSIDLKLQKVAETALAEQIAITQERQDTTDKTKFATYKAPAGSVVVVDPQNGFVRAMASYPTYDPTQFVEGISTPLWKELNDPENAYPLNNRAIQGLYAPASTFKLITSIAGVRSGIISPNSTFNDTGSLQVSDRVFNNAGKKANGIISLSRALSVSSDTFYYNIGSKLWSMQRKGDEKGNAIQDTAREFGFAERTGIPLGNEAKGRIPDQEWKKQIHEEYPEAFPYAEWLPGDNVNTSIGQGDTLVTPIQMAMAYGAFANEGTLYAPQLVSEIRPAGSKKAEKTFEKEVKRTIEMSPALMSVMKQGFRGAVADEDGTANGAFGGFPSDISVAGKTGTAQVNGKQDTSWFVGYTPSDNPNYVAVAVVEEAGWGAGTAAPIVRRTFAGAYGLDLANVTFTPATGVSD
jgi:penicillin-binding protein 2